MRDKRRKEMAAYIARRQSATMEELREVFHVSMNTVRSDVHALVHTGAVEKVYGGVRSAVRQEVPLFTQRDSTHTGAKERIARLAETRIADGDTVYLDAGTTTLRLLECLDPAKHVTVISGNLAAAGPAYNLPRVELIVLPGLMNRFGRRREHPGVPGPLPLRQGVFGGLRGLPRRQAQRLLLYRI